MALSASPSTVAQTVTSSLTSTSTDGKAASADGHPQGVIPLPAKPATEIRGAGLRRNKSLRPVKNAKVEEAVATASEEVLEGMKEGDAGTRRRSGKASSRLSRRRALVLCLALGMVRPCAGDLQQGSDLRRTVSQAILRTASSSFQVPATLVSQVSLATTLKQTNFLGEQQDLQKLTTLQ